MLRQAASRLGAVALRQTGRTISTSAAASDSLAPLIKAVKESNASTFTSGGLSNLKGYVTPYYPAPATQAAPLSPQAKALLGATALWFLYRADLQAGSHDWIVDLSLNVLQSAWLISFASFIPFRSVFVALRGASPMGSSPLAALKPAFNLKP